MNSSLFSCLIGNDKVKRYLSDALRQETVPHALIIEGARGSGKHTLVTELICAMSGAENEEKIRNGTCVDVIVTELPPDRKSIGVEAAREIRRWASIEPNDLDGKFFVIHDAAALTLQAQNALLKILEEPCEGVWFFLLTENASEIIPTVRSRAPTLTMQRFGEDEILSYLLSEDSTAQRLQRENPDRLHFAVRRCGGSIGLAQKYLRGRADDSAMKAAEGLFEALSAGDPVRLLLCLEALPSDREKLRDEMDVVRCAIRDLLLFKTVTMREASDSTMERVNRSLICFADAEQAQRHAAGFSVRCLLRMEEAVRCAGDDLGANANIANTKQSLGVRLRAACGK